MRNIPTILIAVLMVVSAVFSASSVASDAAGAAIAPSAGSPILGGPAISTGSADGTKSPPSGYLGGPLPSTCSMADSVSCGGIAPAPTPAVSCSNIASDAAVSKCIKSAIQSGTIGAPATDRATQQKRPTSSTACVLRPSPLSVPVNTKSEISISCFNVDGEIACPGITWSATIGTISGSPYGAGYKSSSAPGRGTISAAGIGADGVAFSCTAQVTVSSPLSAATSCTLAPSSLTIGVNQHQVFIASCSDIAGNEVSCPIMSWTATIGTAAPADDTYSADFVSATSGSGIVRATGRTPTDNVVGTFFCQSDVTVMSMPTTIFSCQLTPSSLTIGVNGHQEFSVACYDRAGSEVPCSNDISWYSDAGTLVPNPDGTQSMIFTAQSTPGSGSISAGGNNGAAKAAPTHYSCSAPVTVTASPAPVASIRLVPKELIIAAGGKQQFIANAYDANGSFIRTLSNNEVGWSILPTALANVGSIDKNGVFTALSAGSAVVRGTYVVITPAIIYADAPVTVTNGSAGQIAAITVSPSSASLYTGQTQQFIAMAFDASGNFVKNLTPSEAAWSLDNPLIGAVDSNGLFRAVGVGATNLTATYITITPGAKIEGKALVSVSSTPPESGGGNGGVGGSGGSGGGSFRASTTASISCAGKAGSIAITYYDSKAPSATVDVFYKTGGVEKVFSQTVSGTSTLSFTPQKEGLYELHITLGTEQTTADFSVQSCTPATINVTQNVTVQLQPVRELLLRRSIDYKGGLSKEFRVYKITDGERVDYQTEVDLLYVYRGNGSMGNFTIKDSVPRSVVSFPNQVSFQTYPAAMSSDQGVGFEWHVSSVKSGQQLKFSYSMERLLTEQMIDSFAAPSLMTSQEREALITAQQGTGSNLLASMIGIGSFSIQLSLLLIILGVILVAALLYAFIFGKKKEE